MRATHVRRGRPSRYGLAAIIGGLVLLAVVASSVLSFASHLVPAGAGLIGLPTIGFVLAGTMFARRGLHAVQHDERGRDLSRAAVLIGAGLFLWLLTLDLFTFTRCAGAGVATTCAIACVPTTALGLFAVRRLDRNEKEPWRLVLVTALWGAIVSTSVVVWAEAFWDAAFARVLAPGAALDASNATAAGTLEELAKGTAVVLLYLVMRDEFDNVVDGIVYGAAVGFGFNFMETISYMTHAYVLHGANAAAGQWYGRQVLGLFFGHATYTALIGAGVGIARQLPRSGQRLLVIGAGFVVAIGAHFIWDAWQFPPPGSQPTVAWVHLRTLVLQGPFTALVLLLLAIGLEIEGRALTRQLQAEAASGRGAVSPDEVQALVTPWRRLAARLRALARGGPAAYLRQAHLQTVQLDLAMARWHRERQETDEPPDVEDALRRRAAALRA